MGLQVRLRHAMGERVLEIPETSADRPFVLGRAPESNFVVPSVSVAPRQCVLFVHEGQWVVQEWTPGGTRLNGRPLDGPTPLSIGDVLTIGTEANAATLEIDPGAAALGRRGSPALEGVQLPTARPTSVDVATPQPPAAPRPRPAPAPAAPARPRPAPAPAAPARPRPAPAPATPPRPRPAPAPATPPRPRPAPAPTATPPRPRPAPAPTAAGAALARPDANPPQPRAVPPQPVAPAGSVAGDTEEVIDWAAVTASAEEAAQRGPGRRKTSSSGSLVVAILLGIAIVGATAWFVRKKMHEPPQVVVIQLPAPARPRTQPSTVPVVKPPDGSGGQTNSDSTSSASGAPANATADDNDPTDPHAGDPDWPDILIAHDMPDPAIAILRYDDYRRRNPGKNDKILKEFEAEAMDRMWWRRITQLCHRRDRLVTEIQEKQKAIAEEGEASVKAQLQSDKASLLEDQKTTNETLRNVMGFTEDLPPDFNDEKALDAARTKRDRGKFADWAKETLAYVRRNNGATPWGNEDL